MVVLTESRFPEVLQPAALAGLPAFHVSAMVDTKIVTLSTQRQQYSFEK
jgi:hypothetical protein